MAEANIGLVLIGIALAFIYASSQVRSEKIHWSRLPEKIVALYLGIFGILAAGYYLMFTVDNVAGYAFLAGFIDPYVVALTWGVFALMFFHAGSVILYIIQMVRVTDDKDDEDYTK